MKVTFKAVVTSLALLNVAVLGQVPPPNKNAGPECLLEAYITCNDKVTGQECGDIPMFDQDVCKPPTDIDYVDYTYTVEYIVGYKNKIQKRNKDNKIKLYKDKRSFAKLNTVPIWIRRGQVIGIKEERVFKRDLIIDPCESKQNRAKNYIGEIQIEGDVQGHSQDGVKEGFHCYAHDFYKKPVLIKEATVGGIVDPAAVGGIVDPTTTSLTPVPTSGPTMSPTMTPTVAPTVAPTDTVVVTAPTSAPISAPTSAPTSTPTEGKGKGKSAKSRRNRRM